MSPLPPNVHASTHPLLHAKLSLLRSRDTDSRETKRLVNDIATILGVEALAGLAERDDGTVSLSFSSPAFLVFDVLAVLSGLVLWVFAA